MGFIWYSDEFQQFLQDINRGVRSVNRSNFVLSATIAEHRHGLWWCSWGVGYLSQGFNFSDGSNHGEPFHFNPEHMKRYAWSATARADLENYSQKGQKVNRLCIWGHWMEACPRNKLIWGSKVQHLTRTFPAITVPTSSDFQSWSIRAVLFMTGWPDQHLSSQLSSVRWVLQVFDCTSRPDKTRRGMAGMVSATPRMGRCCWADEPCG